MTPKQKEAVHSLVYQSRATFEGLIKKKRGEWSEDSNDTFLEHRQAMFDRLKDKFPHRTPAENDAMWTELKAGFAEIKKSLTGE